MSTNINFHIPDSAIRFWTFAKNRGDKTLLPLWLIVHIGDFQPRGYVQGWNIKKSAAFSAQQHISGTTVLIKVKPEDYLA